MTYSFICYSNAIKFFLPVPLDILEKVEQSRKRIESALNVFKEGSHSPSGDNVPNIELTLKNVYRLEHDMIRYKKEEIIFKTALNCLLVCSIATLAFGVNIPTSVAVVGLITLPIFNCYLTQKKKALEETKIQISHENTLLKAWIKERGDFTVKNLGKRFVAALTKLTIFSSSVSNLIDSERK